MTRPVLPYGAATCRRQSQRGFTLLEMMVALALLALTGLMGAQILRSVLQSGDLTLEHAGRLGAVQQAFSLLEQDISQALARPVPPDLDQATSAPLLAQPQSGQTLRLLRRNWQNPAGWLPRGLLEEVQWQKTEHGLQRWSQAYSSPLPSQMPPRLSAVFPQVSEMRLRYAIGGRWQESWFASYAVPQAVEVTLTVSGYGELVRVFFITDAL